MVAYFCKGFGLIIGLITGALAVFILAGLLLEIKAAIRLGGERHRRGK